MQRRHPQAVFAVMRRGEDLAAHYASADMLLFPSTTDTCGNVTPEAMASALPVLAYDYAAAAQLIRSGDNGMLASFDQTESFIACAATMACDPAGLAAMGQRARESMHAQGWDRIIGQVEALLRQALAQPLAPVLASAVVAASATTPAWP